MSSSVGEGIDSELETLAAKIDLLAEYMGVEFEYSWGELHGIRKIKDEPGLHLCRSCWCMTKTINGRCGKCGAERRKDE